MALVSFVQTDGASGFAGAALCTGLTLTGGTPKVSLAAVGGSVGSTGVRPTLAALNTDRPFYFIDYGARPAGYTGVLAGDATIHLAVTNNDSGQNTLTSLYLCHTDSSFNSLATIGSLTGLADTLAVGTYTKTITIASDVPMAATDRIVLCVGGTNVSVMSTFYTEFTPSQTDTIPMVPAGPPVGTLAMMGCGR